MTPSLVVPVVAGVVAGIVANYIADSLPLSRRLGVPFCANCGSPYPWNAYLWGRACPHCGHGRGVRPMLLLGAMVCLSIFTWLQPHKMGYLAGLLLLTYFGVIVTIDIEHRLILHPTSIVGALLAFGIGVGIWGAVRTLEGGLAGLAVMLALYGFGILFSRLRARRLRAAGRDPDEEDALGWGDVILGGIIGLLLGWPLIVAGLVMGILLGGLLGLIVIVATLIRGSYRQQALMLFMPYAPSFILSTFLILFTPELISGLMPRVP